MTEQAIIEIKNLLVDARNGAAEQNKKIAELEAAIKGHSDEALKLRADLNDARKKLLTRSQPSAPFSVRANGGRISKEAAIHLASIYIVAAKNHGREVKSSVREWCLERLVSNCDEFSSDPNGAALKEYRGAITGDLQSKAALTTSDIPLPVDYQIQLFELVEQYGTFRQYAEVIPMGAGTVKLKKLGNDPEFGFIDTSGTVPEKSPSIADVDLDAKKAGGLVRVPTEIDEDSLIMMGQFIARYIARKSARWEDLTGWLADGTATYKTLQGVRHRINANSKFTQLSTGGTGTDDVTLASLRTIRGQVNSAVLMDDPAYYMHPSMEALLSGFNASGTNPWNPERNTLDGFPVRWVNVLSPYATTAVINTIVAAFGSMRYWALGLRGGMRIDTSMEKYFDTDEMAIRALWRFTVGETATDHMAGVKTAAS